AGTLFNRLERLKHLIPHTGRKFARGAVSITGFCCHRKPRRNRASDAHHFSELGSLTAQKRLHVIPLTTYDFLRQRHFIKQVNPFRSGGGFGFSTAIWFCRTCHLFPSSLRSGDCHLQQELPYSPPIHSACSSVIEHPHRRNVCFRAFGSLP